jgi:hypothetical protein
VTEHWIAAAAKQLASLSIGERTGMLRGALGYPTMVPARIDGRPRPRKPFPVLVDTADPALERELSRKALRVVPIRFTPFDETAAAKIRHFETYNRTPASQRVADIVAALQAHPDAGIVAQGDAALAALLATVIVRPRAAVLDVAGFDPSIDDDYLQRLFIPGVRRAGGIETAVASGRRVLIHNSRRGFGGVARGDVEVETRRLTPREIADAIESRMVAR